VPRLLSASLGMPLLRASRQADSAEMGSKLVQLAFMRCAVGLDMLVMWPACCGSFPLLMLSLVSRCCGWWPTLNWLVGASPSLFGEGWRHEEALPTPIGVLGPCRRPFTFNRHDGNKTLSLLECFTNL
jgi:hypothetical protein